MTLPEIILHKLRQFSEEHQREVLTYVEKIETEYSSKERPWRDPYGSCADLRTDLSFEEFLKNRQEMWGRATHEEFL
jgi:hypothetical protein